MRYTYERVLRHVPSHVRDVFTREEELAGIDFSTYSVKVYDNLHACIKVADLGSEDDVDAWLVKVERDQWSLQQKAKLAASAPQRVAVLGQRPGVATMRQLWHPFEEAGISLKQQGEGVRIHAGNSPDSGILPAGGITTFARLRNLEAAVLDMMQRSKDRDFSVAELQHCAYYLGCMILLASYGEVSSKKAQEWVNTL
jgi:hypothetical protein